MTEKVSKAFPVPDEENEINISTAEMHTKPRGHGEVHIEKLRNQIPVLKQLNQFESWLDKKVGMESTGADRILEDEREPPSVLNVGVTIETLHGDSETDYAYADDVPLVLHVDKSRANYNGTTRAREFFFLFSGRECADEYLLNSNRPWVYPSSTRW